jgi:hypothetical protein
LGHVGHGASRPLGLGVLAPRTPTARVSPRVGCRGRQWAS